MTQGITQFESDFETIAQRTLPGRSSGREASGVVRNATPADCARPEPLDDDEIDVLRRHLQHASVKSVNARIVRRLLATHDVAALSGKGG